MINRRVVSEGVAAGLVAAILSSIPGAIDVMLGDTEWWYPPQLIATIAGFPPPVAFDLPALLVGGVIHLVISVGYGIAFAVLVPTRAVAPLLALGLIYGFVTYLIGFPLSEALGVFPTLVDGADHTVELFAHLAYGTALGAAIWLLRHPHNDTGASKPPIRGASKPQA